MQYLVYLYLKIYNGNQYYLIKRKRRESYQVLGNNMFSENDYTVSLTNNNRTIVI